MPPERPAAEPGARRLKTVPGYLKNMTANRYMCSAVFCLSGQRPARPEKAGCGLRVPACRRRGAGA